MSADPSKWTDIERAFVWANPDLQQLYNDRKTSLSPTEFLSYAESRSPEKMEALLQKDLAKYVKSGTDRSFWGRYGYRDFMDMEQWGEGRVEWTYNPNKAKATGIFNRSTFSSPYSTGIHTIASNMDLWNRWDAYQGIYAEEQAAEQKRLSDYQANQDELRASGVPAWELDPTPGDGELTIQDQIQQQALKQEHAQGVIDGNITGTEEPDTLITGNEGTKKPSPGSTGGTGEGNTGVIDDSGIIGGEGNTGVIDDSGTMGGEGDNFVADDVEPRNDRGETKAEEAERIARETVEAEREIQRKGEKDELTELWGLRSESEKLAKQDAYNYLMETSTSMIMQGVTPPFDDSYREKVERHRFSQYWSQENEDRLLYLAEGTEFKHGLPGEVKLRRTASEQLESQNIQTSASQMQSQIETGAAITSTDLMVTGLLEEDHELLEAKQYLGG